HALPRPAGTALATLGPFTFEGGWVLSSRNGVFGGYSALVPTAGGLRAYSDLGYILDFAIPTGTIGHLNARISRLYPDRDMRKANRDIEAATMRAGAATIWLGAESRNAIIRIDPTPDDRLTIRPRVMRGWPENKGPEALAALPDGRFVVLGESFT
ncbi:esterase-like activity of phytase family protein, partial [Ectopseudomonas mendocina]|uniref:esterase-like activity of phytase family protein n=1 Tax=Ectopseudomonas mendocina TaxID=300 RepID=UPI003132ABDB